MRVTLGKKLFLYTSATVLILLLATFLVLERSQSRQWEDYLETQNISFARFATPELLKMFRGNFSSPTISGTTAIYDFLGFNRDLVQFSLLSTSGHLLYQSPRFPDYIDLGLTDVEDVEGLSEEMVARITSRTLHLSEGVRLLEIINPAFGPTGEHLLSVRFLISYDSVDARLREVRRHFLRLGLAAILLSLMLVALVSRRVTRPIQDLTEGARAVARGELQTRIPFASSDEIGALARAFNDMAASLSSSRSQLTEKNDALLAVNRELVTMQQQLIRSERLATIGQLAAGVSHEIDNPVGIILGYAELLLEDLEQSDPRRDDVQAIIEECRRCRRITGGLLGLARSTSSECTALEINALLAGVFDSLRPQKIFRYLELDLMPSPDNPRVVGDSDQLRQVFVNLMLNAAQALGGQGRIGIEVRTGESKVEVLVVDSGSGIAEEIRDRIFDPFFSTKPRGEGTGLGLTLCRQLIEEHGGSIDVESSGGGGRFRIVLPRG